jgi:hypothetical protein
MVSKNVEHRETHVPHGFEVAIVQTEHVVHVVTQSQHERGTNSGFLHISNQGVSQIADFLMVGYLGVSANDGGEVLFYPSGKEGEIERSGDFSGGSKASVLFNERRRTVGTVDVEELGNILFVHRKVIPGRFHHENHHFLSLGKSVPTFAIGLRYLQTVGNTDSRHTFFTGIQNSVTVSVFENHPLESGTFLSQKAGSEDKDRHSYYKPYPPGLTHTEKPPFLEYWRKDIPL